MGKTLEDAIQAVLDIPTQQYDLDVLEDIVEEYDLTAVDLLEQLAHQKPQSLDEDAAACVRVNDVAFRLANGELTPEVVCLAAITARDYHAHFGKYPAALMPPAHYEAFDDWIADLAEAAVGVDSGKLDGSTRFRAGDLNKQNG